MKLYLRILRHASKLNRQLPLYLVVTFLGIAFSVGNFAMIIPFLDILFNKVEPVATELVKPELSLSTDSLKAWFNWYFASRVEESGRIGALTTVVIFMIVSVMLTNLFRYLSALVLAAMRADIITAIRQRAFGAVLRMHLGYFTESRRGDIMSRLSNDTLETEYTIINTVKVFFKEPVTIIIYFTMLFLLSWQLTLFSILVLPISGTLISILIKKLRKKAIQGQESLSRVLSIMDESLGAMRIIKGFNAERIQARRFKGDTDNYGRIMVSMARKSDLATPLSEFLGVMVTALILFFGGSLVLQGEGPLSASQFLAYIFLYSQILPAAKNLSNSLSGLQRGLTAARRVFELVDTEPEIKNRPGAKKLASFQEEIRFENLSFAYGEKQVLSKIDLTIKKGQTVALVGPSGAGKSTLADLLPRFYDPTGGAIYVDGTDIRDLEVESLRSHLGLVTQESILFNDTILSNIAFGADEVNLERAIEAAKVANAHRFIEEMEDGYYSNIGEQGSKLSGGQRQRLSIARAVYKNPAILVLDEATSALDSESELLVQEALTKLMEGRTSLVIAHRLSTIQSADEIVVMEAGRIVERGTHEQLTSKAGLYARFTAMQTL